MSRLLPIAFIVWVAFTVFTIVDVALIEKSRVRGLPKPGWIVLVIVLPIVGGVLWYAVGRIRTGEAAIGSARRGPIAPDDDPEFLRRLNREKAMEDRIEQLEQELRDLDDDPPKP
ncbi:PLD nuclease N-terminal domain-containing protein [Pseudolysinimonas sp.]|jgi:hypothetical protein|uniref:PLD nuclease N-terminal domain-containing protein n=1 Tax=Pseudolysinimonas sp. TaxID=2680009 RepID=UPI0037837DEA